MSTSAPDGPGMKFDEGKPRYDLVPRMLIEEAAKVFAFGANKYGDRNWEKGISNGRLYAAMQRHLFAWWSGEECDDESGLSHLGHAACCMMMLGEFELMHQTGMERPETAADTRPEYIRNWGESKIAAIRDRARAEFLAGQQRAAEKLDTALTASVCCADEASTDSPHRTTDSPPPSGSCPPPLAGSSGY